MRRNISNNFAFTLVELSIVFIVIAFIAGGIIAGMELRDNYKLMSIISDIEKYRSDIKGFKDKYDYYPGDFPDATTIWGAMTSPAACDTAGTTSAGSYSTTPVSLTCDGRGNGVIGWYFTDSAQFAHAAPDANTDMRELREKFYMWQHLALAGFIDGQYSGYSSTTGNNNAVSPGVNVPATNYSDKLGFTIEYWPDNNLTLDATAAWPPVGYIHHLFSWSHPNVGIGSAELITSSDALSIDEKIDDGLPFSGKVFAHGRDNGANGEDVDDCTSGTEYQVGSYACGQYYRNFLE